MKISKQTIDIILKAIKLGKLVDIKTLKVTKEFIGGENEDKSCFLLTNQKIKENFGTFTSNRNDVLASRLALVIGDDSFKVDCVIDKRDELTFVKLLNLKSKHVKAEFRCCVPSMVKTPRKINTDVNNEIKFSKEIVEILTKAISSTDSEFIIFNCTNDAANFQLSDLSKDTIEIDLNAEINAAESNLDLSFKYNLRTMSSLLKNTSNPSIFIGAKGLMKIPVDGFDFYAIPQTEI